MLPPGYINFVSVDLNQVLQIYAELVGRTILRPANLASAPIILKTQTELTKAEAIQALNAVLALNNIAVINVAEKFVKVVPITQAPTEAAAWHTNGATSLPEMGQYLTHVVQLKYARPTEMVPILQAFGKVPNSVFPIESSQILVLRDYTENVKRMLEMIERVDVIVPSEFISEVIPIKYALASEIASALNSLGGGGGGAGASIGRPSSGRTGGTPGGLQRPGGAGYNPGSPFGGQAPGLTPGQPATGVPSSTSSFSDRLQRIIQRASASGDLQILGTTKIIADERANALLVFATRPDMEMIKNIISKLDVVLAQVLIETIIMDVQFDNSFSFGVSAVQTPRQFGKDFVGAGGMNASRLFDFAGGGSTNGAGDLLGSGLRYFGKVGDDIHLNMQAAAADGRVNVIQKPRIQTSHATPASIFIGSTVPYVTGSYYGGYGGGPGASYQQLRVGIGLNVTPFINQDGLVVMKIDEQIEEISGSTAIESIGNVPNTTSRTLSAEIAVRDGETIILGGFIRNSDNTTKSGVPYLKDIPLLGYLFRSTSKSKERKELIVLMRPTVLRTPELAALQVGKEKERLPGVTHAEIELDKEESKSAREAQKRESQKRLFNKVVPFTPEEERIFSNPAPVQP